MTPNSTKSLLSPAPACAAERLSAVALTFALSLAAARSSSVRAVTAARTESNEGLEGARRLGARPGSRRGVRPSGDRGCGADRRRRGPAGGLHRTARDAPRRVGSSASAAATAGTSDSWYNRRAGAYAPAEPGFSAIRDLVGRGGVDRISALLARPTGASGFVEHPRTPWRSGVRGPRRGGRDRCTTRRPGRGEGRAPVLRHSRAVALRRRPAPWPVPDVRRWRVERSRARTPADPPRWLAAPRAPWATRPPVNRPWNPSPFKTSSTPECTSDAAPRGGIRTWPPTSTAGGT